MKHLVSSLKVFLIAAVASAFGAACVLAIATWHAPGGWSSRQRPSSTTPGMDLADALQCEPGQRRIVEVRGREDGFSRNGHEPARIDPRLLANGYYRDFHEGNNSVAILRKYDESGSDKVFMDYFDLPPAIGSIQLVLRYRGFPGGENDVLQLGDLLIDPAGSSSTARAVFGQAVATLPSPRRLDDGSWLVVLDPADMKNIDPRKSRYGFRAFLHDRSRTQQLDLLISDDTSVDFAALVSCQEPLQVRGVTYSEHHFKPAGANLSWLSCNFDHTQPGCDPLAGDQMCDAATPLGCYLAGNRKLDSELLKNSGMNADSFAGGEVRITEPVRGDQFATLEQANAFCRQRFGQDWRVLSYHEGGAGGIITYSKIPPGTRMWIDIRDQRRANCWDRNQER